MWSVKVLACCSLVLDTAADRGEADRPGYRGCWGYAGGRGWGLGGRRNHRGHRRGLGSGSSCRRSGYSGVLRQRIVIASESLEFRLTGT